MWGTWKVDKWYLEATKAFNAETLGAALKHTEPFAQMFGAYYILMEGLLHNLHSIRGYGNCCKEGRKIEWKGNCWHHMRQERSFLDAPAVQFHTRMHPNTSSSSITKHQQVAYITPVLTFTLNDKAWYYQCPPRE